MIKYFSIGGICDYQLTIKIWWWPGSWCKSMNFERSFYHLRYKSNCNFLMEKLPWLNLFSPTAFSWSAHNSPGTPMKCWRGAATEHRCFRPVTEAYVDCGWTTFSGSLHENGHPGVELRPLDRNYDESRQLYLHVENIIEEKLSNSPCRSWQHFQLHCEKLSNNSNVIKYPKQYWLSFVYGPKSLHDFLKRRSVRRFLHPALFH